MPIIPHHSSDFRAHYGNAGRIAAVEAEGGAVKQFLGDGVMALLDRYSLCLRCAARNPSSSLSTRMRVSLRESQ